MDCCFFNCKFRKSADELFCFVAGAMDRHISNALASGESNSTILTSARMGCVGPALSVIYILNICYAVLTHVPQKSTSYHQIGGTYIEPTAFGAQVVNFTTKVLASHSGFPQIAILQYTHSSAITQIAGGHLAGRAHTHATATLNIIKY
uniref:Uncharacterized protein n=1 Tax=Glossina austeni TaxID=7395 RepID=A0A1A9VQ26_GLOAU